MNERFLPKRLGQNSPIRKTAVGNWTGDIAKSSSPMATDLTVRRLKPLLSPEQAILRQSASKTASKPEKEYCKR